MLTKRVVLSLCTSHGQLVRTKWFRPDRTYTLNYVDLELADEILLLDVTRGGRSPAYWDCVDRLTDALTLPLTLGGYMKSLADATHALRRGADKVLYNTAVCNNPHIITEVAKKHGSQAMVVGIDVEDGEVIVNQGQEMTGRHVVDWACEAQDRGAGELVVMDIRRDGSLTGYNLDLLRSVVDKISIPVIAVGGCGNWRHMDEAFAVGCTGAATAVIHHLTPGHLAMFKGKLAERHPIRT